MDYTLEEVQSEIGRTLQLDNDSFDLLHRYAGKTQNKCHWLLSLPLPQADKLLHQGKILLFYTSIHVVRCVSIVRCYKCQILEHILKNCTHASPTCSKCAGQHFTRDCSSRSECCANCTRNNMTRVDHITSDSSCLSFITYRNMMKDAQTPRHLHTHTNWSYHSMHSIQQSIPASHFVQHTVPSTISRSELPPRPLLPTQIRSTSSHSSRNISASTTGLPNVSTSETITHQTVSPPAGNNTIVQTKDPDAWIRLIQKH